MAGYGYGYFQGSVQIGSLLNPQTLLERNADIVVESFYSDITTSANLTAGIPGRGYCNISNLTKVRQNGNIVKVQFYWGLVNKPAELYLQVWRFNGTTYDLVGEENIIASLVSSSVNDITLATPILAQEGDHLGIWSTNIDGGGACWSGITGQPFTSNRFATMAKPTTPFDYNSKTAGTFVIPIKVYTQAPLVVGIGDSVVAGHPAHYSFIENSLTVDLPNSIFYQLKEIDANYVYQNMGIGSKTSTQIAARFAADVVALKPKIALIQGGVNDIAGGVIDKATFLANYTAMLDACVAASIVPVVFKIIPWTNGTTAQMRIRDDWNADLAALVATYEGAICIDFDSTLGQFDPTGDAGNLWDIKAAYDADGVHPNLAGYTAMAVKIDTEIKKLYKFV